MRPSCVGLMRLFAHSPQALASTVVVTVEQEEEDHDWE